MCARYTPPRWDELHEVHRAPAPENLPVATVFPRGKGAFIRRVATPELDAPEIERELVVAQWALIPAFAKTAKLPYSTNNASGALVTVRRWQSARIHALEMPRDGDAQTI